MKKNRYILAGLTAATLLATACSEIDEDQSAQEQTVPVTFYLRSAGPNTRATEDVKTGTDAENTIYSAKVWLYQSAYTDAQSTEHAPLLLGYQDASFSEDDEREITINIPKAVVEAGRKLDVYAIANAASVDLSTKNAATGENPNSFDNVYLAGDNFTPQTRTASPGVPTDGLPMSQIAKNQDIIPDGTQYTLNKIDLVRAISKIRFAFARPTGMQDVEITGIEIDGNLIPNQERIFPLQSEDDANYAKVGDIQFNGDRYTNLVKTGTDANDYIQTKVVYDKSATAGSFNTALVSSGSEDGQIKEHDNPELLVYQNSGGTIRQYDALITPYVINSLDTYLRESDKLITGTIYYRYGSTETTQSATFTMPAPIEGQGPDFARNHIYTVYGHFKNGELCLTLTVNPWELKEYSLDYSESLQVPNPISWKAGTYNESRSYPLAGESSQGFRPLTLNRGVTAECTFEITSPEGFVWTASFNTISGNPAAFKFVDKEGNLSDTYSGTVGTGLSTLRIKATNDTPTVNSTAQLVIVVRQGEGKNLPVETLNKWMIVQAI